MSSTRQTTVGAIPAGAGRTAMMTWPGYGETVNSGAGPGTSPSARGGVTAQTGISVGNAATGSSQWQNYATAPTSLLKPNDARFGSLAMRLLNAANGDDAFIKFNQGPSALVIEQLSAGVQPDPFFRVYRLVASIAFPAVAGPVGAADIGLMLLPGNTTNMNTGPGIMLGITDVNTISLRTRGGFGAAFDSTQSFTAAQLGLGSLDTWITYELRLISADANGPGQLKTFVNGKQFGNALNFGLAAAVLPGPTASGSGFAGYVPMVRNRALGAYTFYVRHFSQMWAPDEASALG